MESLNKRILECIYTNLPKDEFVNLSVIKEEVKTHANLTDEDKNWEHSLRAVLSKNKSNGNFLHEERVSAKNAKDKIAKEPRYLFKSL